MTIKTTFVALILVMSPGLAAAMGCQGGDHAKSAAISCAEGTMLDPDSGTCVPLTTG